MSETNTPETDVIARNKHALVGPECASFVPAEFARGLERERNHFKNLVGLASAYVFEDGTRKGIRDVVVERDEAREARDRYMEQAVRFAQEREHNAMQALMWKSVADGLAREISALPCMPSPMMRALIAYDEANAASEGRRSES